jgi:hypothetical protein
MTDWFAKGCAGCRKAALSGLGAPLTFLSDDAHGPIRLYRCAACGVLWRESLREAHVIDENEARKDFPRAFQRGTK